MKLLYTTSIDVPSTRANRLQTVNMARAFYRILNKNFLFGLRLRSAGYELNIPVIEFIERRSFILAWRYVRLAERDKYTHIYCREEKLLFFMMIYNRFIVRIPLLFCYEIHHLAYVDTWWHRYVLRHASKVISITHAMKEVLVGMGYPRDGILVAPDAVDGAMFDINVNKDVARRQLGLPADKHIILYTGTINESWKGVGILYEAVRQLGDDYLCVIVGGKPHYVDEFNLLHVPIPNVRLVGHKPHDEIPLYMKAADVCVLPNSATAEISRISTSPLKLFEYMAAGRPIVASDLPSIREIVNEKSAVLVSPDSAAAFANGIRSLIEDPSRATGLAKSAYKAVSEHTWDNRAASITEFIDHA